MSETLRHVHFVAIGGTGMGSLAGLLAARGLRVTGSDDALYPPMSTLLERWGIPVRDGFRPEHVLDDPPDLTVIGNAVRPDNPEARAAIDEGLRYLSFPDALRELAIEGRHSVVVAGTHGKSTTTSLIGHVLHATGRDPSLLVGGFSLDFGGSFREGGGEHFVVEGDEYDTAFFDKTPKFLHYAARTLVVTSIEFDHADIYRDLGHVKDAFRQVVAKLPRDGALVAAMDEPNVREIAAEAPCRVVGYGASEAGEGVARFRAGRALSDPDGTHFDVLVEGRAAGRALLPLYGTCNVENALAALAVADVLGVPLGEAIPALATVQGMKRRQELRGEVNGILVYDDFAHHPTAVRASLEALRARHPDRRLVAVFEPRTNTTRRAVFQRAYADAFTAADRVVVADPPDGPLYSNTGETPERFSAKRLASDLTLRGTPAAAPGGVDDIVALLRKESRPGDVLLVMSNGAFGGIWERLLSTLRE